MADSSHTLGSLAQSAKAAPRSVVRSFNSASQSYNLVVSATGLIILLDATRAAPLDPKTLVLFTFLGCIGQLLPVRFYKNASVSMAMAVALAAILVGGPAYAIWANLGSGVVHYLTRVRPKHSPFYRAAVTTATLIISAWVGGQLYIGITGGLGLISAYTIFPLSVAALVYYLANTTIITQAIALEQRVDFWKLLKTNFQWLTLNVASLTAMGFGIAYIYSQLQLVGLVLFLIPVGMAWFSFQLYARSAEDIRLANEELQTAQTRIQDTNAELREANERLNVMYEVSRLLARSLRMGDTINAIMSAIQLMGFRQGMVIGPVNAPSPKEMYGRSTNSAWALLALMRGLEQTEKDLWQLTRTLSNATWFSEGQPRTLPLAKLSLDVDLDAPDSDQESWVTLIPVGADKERWGLVGIGSDAEPSPEQTKELLLFRSMVENALERALAHERAQRDALMDGRTGLFNHRAFQEALQRQWRDAAQRASYLSLLMIDINKFKEFNDQHGHQVGDQVLSIIANLLKKNVREGDFAYRYGGDELCVILPHTGLAKAIEIGTRIDQAIAGYSFLARRLNASPTEELYPIQLRVSIGVSSYPETTTQRQELIEQADQACYRAKKLGGGVAASVRQEPGTQSRPLIQIVR